jgi:hypothetical protein
MQGKRLYLAFNAGHDPKQHLEVLYARRSALDALIRSLEEYQRARTKRLDPLKSKTA